MKALRVTLILAMAGIMAFGASAYSKEKPPEPGKIKDLSFPKFKEIELKNGLEVVVVEHHEQPVASIWLAVKSGDAMDPEGKSSLTQFTASLLNKGTKSKNSDELAEWIESVGGTFNANSQRDFTVITVSILSEYLDTAYEYISELVREATFPEDELEKERKRVKTSLEFQLSDPNGMADRHFNAVVYGNHPYAVQPTVESVEAITRDDIVGFHNRNYVANNAIMFVVGDVKSKDVKKDVEKYFSAWHKGTPDHMEFPEPPERTARNIALYHRPNSVQTNLYVGHLGLKPDNPDWASVTVANRILGDGATGRLFMNLREDKGWTYGAYSTFTRNVDYGYFRATANVRTEVTDSSLTEMLSEFERIVDEPVGEDELEHAKSYLIGNFPTRIETPSQIAAQIGQVKLLGLDKKQLENYRKEIAKVTVEDVQQSMRKYLHPQQMAMVLVGDATEIKDKVEPIASVQLYDIEGTPLNEDELAIEGIDFDFDTDVLKDFKAVYSVTVQDAMELGDMNVSLKRTDEGFSSTTVLDGMLKLDEKQMLGTDNLEPLNYSYSMNAMGQMMSADIGFANGSATGRIEGGKDGPIDVDVKLVQGTILGSAIDVAIATLKLSPGDEFKFPTLDPSSGALENVKVEVLGEEDLMVPAGSYATFKLSIKTGDGERYYYVTRDVPHMVVKQEIPAQRLAISLKHVEM